MNVKIPQLIHVGGQDINIELVDKIEGDKLGQCSVFARVHKDSEVKPWKETSPLISVEHLLA